MDASRPKKGKDVKESPAWKRRGWLFKSRVFWLFCLLFMTVGVSVQIVMVHIVPYGQSRGASPMISAAVLSSITGASMVGRIVMGISSDWIGRRRALMLSTFMEGIMLLWLMATSSTWSLFLFGIFFGFFYGGHAPQLPALIGETFGLEHMGAILGVMTLFWGIGSAIGPFVAGYLVDTTGSYRVGFMISAAMILVASAIGFVLKASEDSPVNQSKWSPII